MTLPGVEKKVDVTFILNERDIRLGANIIAEKGYRVLGVKRNSGVEMEIEAFFGAADIFEAMNRLEDDDVYGNVINLKINGYLNRPKRIE